MHLNDLARQLPGANGGMVTMCVRVKTRMCISMRMRMRLRLRLRQPQLLSAGA